MNTRVTLSRDSLVIPVARGYDGYEVKEVEVRTGTMSDSEFENFVTDTNELALRVAWSYLRDWDEARDAVQEAFIKAFRKAQSFRGDASRRTWFMRILTNHLRDRLRRRAVRSWLVPWSSEGAMEEVIADQSPDPARAAELKALKVRLQDALDALPAGQRQICKLHLEAGMTLAEAAQVAGIKTGTAKTHYFRGVEKLRQSLKEEGVEHLHIPEEDL